MTCHQNPGPVITIGMTTIFFVESALEYCNRYGTVCVNDLLLSFEGWISSSYAVVLVSIVQKPPVRQTAIGT